MHLVAKQLGVNVDHFMYALEPLGALLWFGDVETARAGFAKVLDAHKRVLDCVQQGEATADGCVQANRLPFSHSCSSVVTTHVAQVSLRDHRWSPLAALRAPSNG